MEYLGYLLSPDGLTTVCLTKKYKLS
jgi:hypothetical protein